MDATAIPQSLLAGACATLSGVIVFLFTRLEKSTTQRIEDKDKYLLAVQAEHAKRLEDKDRATAALLAQNDRLHSSLEKMSELVEAIGRPTPRS